ncbi:MAG: DUF6159 family protein [bacterium]
MGKFGRSMALVSSSWGVLRSNKSLLWLPVMAFALEAVFIGLVALVAVSTGGLEHWAKLIFQRSLSSLSDVTVLDIVLALGTWIGVSFIAVLSNSVLMAAVFEGFEGRDASLRSGFQVVKPRMGNILRWAILAGSFAFVLNVLYRKGGIVGVVIAWVLDAAWAFATVFVVPILVLKDVGPFEALRESAGLFKRTWGEQVIGGLGIGLTFLAGWIAAIAIVVVAALAGGVWVAVPVGAVLFGALLAAQSAVGAIFTAALYRWANEGAAAPGFEGTDFAAAYVPKKK